jgi:hypothetical protein
MEDKKRSFAKWIRVKEHTLKELDRKVEKYDGPVEMSLDGLIGFLMSGSSEEPDKDYVGQYD